MTSTETTSRVRGTQLLQKERELKRMILLQADGNVESSWMDFACGHAGQRTPW